MRKRLIIITGHPGSGKSTIARQLAERYQLLLISKDALKERIFDTLGTSDKARSLRVSATSHRIMDDIVEQELALGHSVIVESNFKVELDSKRFKTITQKHAADCIQILCEANGNILFERWQKRLQDGTRHEGHVEAIGLEQIRKDLSQPYLPLTLPGRLIKIDTSNVSKIELPVL
jgi:predicted kinase